MWDCGLHLISRFQSFHHRFHTCTMIPEKLKDKEFRSWWLLHPSKCSNVCKIYAGLGSWRTVHSSEDNSYSLTSSLLIIIYLLVTEIWESTKHLNSLCFWKSQHLRYTMNFKDLELKKIITIIGGNVYLLTIHLALFIFETLWYIFGVKIWE